ncbi:MAG: prenyltransferase [Candidatus Bathyarchaeia archaeon]
MCGVGSGLRKKLVIWIREFRPKFLSLSAVLVVLGLALAWREGFMDPFLAALTFIGVVICAHGSVDILNDYFDMGIDIRTNPTPFSGGSRIIQEGLMKPKEVLAEGLILLIGGVIIGTYLTFSTGGWLIPFLVLLGAVCIGLYSPVFSKLGIGEFVVGLNFGLMVLGTYYVQTLRISWEALVFTAVAGIMVGGVLYINEFPDYEADKAEGRYHLIVRLGKDRAARWFKAIPLTAYALIIFATLLDIVPFWSLMALITIPFAVKAVRLCEKYYDDPIQLIPGMASMVMATLGIPVALTIAYVISGLL